MGKKRDKANANIETLIDELIDTWKLLGDGNCPHCGFCPPDNLEDCYECKKRYYENMRDRLLDKYIV